MAKFCTKCGKKLVDGQPCDCEKKEKKEVLRPGCFPTSALFNVVTGCLA